jgi:GNAT superfamily N-acetyltransferase
VSLFERRGPRGGTPITAGCWCRSLVCFYVHPSAKRRGVASALLTAAVERATAGGAPILEAGSSSATDR